MTANRRAVPNAPVRASRIVIASGLLSLLVLIGSPVAADGEARLLRYPTIHRDFVVFVYAGDLWRAASDGGQAWRLTSHDGSELTPKISPDGRWVAYSAQYGGTRQVYVIPAAGGEPKQLTFYNDVGAMPPRGGFDYWIQGWSADGKILVRMNRTPWGQRPGRLYRVDPAGGLEQPLPVPISGSASYSPDGAHLAYTYFDREFRTWKRYQGGRNQDIWTVDLTTLESHRLTDWTGSDNFPMWHGDSIYFTSDREHTLNIYAYDTTAGTTRKVTDFNEYDVLWPSLGENSIVFMNGGWLYRLDLATETVAKIPIVIGDDLPATVPHWETVDDNIADAHLSPDGKRAVFEARGDLYTVPAKDGATRNITQTQGLRESSPAWSPDGASIAYYSDASGEMALMLRGEDGKDEPRLLAAGREVWRYPPIWSPDGTSLAFGDSEHTLRILAVDSGELTTVDSDPQGDIDTYRWSPDSRWLVYEKSHPDTQLPAVAVFSLASGASEILGDGLTFDFDPVFSNDGSYLFFLSNRDYNIHFSDFEFDFVYDNSTRIYAAALTTGAEPLFPLASDEVEIDDGETADDDEDGDNDEQGQGSETEVTVAGFARRVIALPGIEPGNYGDLSAVDGGLLFRQFPADGAPTLMRYELEDREASEIASAVDRYVLASRGEQLLYESGSSWTISSAASDDGETLDLSALRMKIEPRAEWRQMFAEAWRIGRDWFYDEKMHGIDWPAMRERYGALVAHVADRSDLDFLFGEMVSELEAGHSYVQSGETESIDRIEGGMLGAEIEADASGHYRFTKIFTGENWDDDYRSPLTAPGVEVAVGDFLLAIDGNELTTADNPYRLLEGKGDRQVELTVNDKPTATGARTVTVQTITSEGNLRYLDWVTSRMALADRLSGGRIGYLHLPNTAGAGNRMLQKLFYSQSAKDALIIDERYNGGGFIPDTMIELFSRTTLSSWARRGLEPFRSPGFAHNGPKAMLINGYAASGGDALPYYFRNRGLGTLIGTRTWGGLIGISGNPMLVDGGGILYPTFRIFDNDGEWTVENVGVAPDIEVWDLPGPIAAGGDPSLEKAVEVLLEALEDYEELPAPPTPPDMSGD